MESIIRTHLGNKLRFLREKSKKKQFEMAIIFEMKQQNYRRIEKGKTNFSDKILHKIHSIFNVEPLDFLRTAIPQSSIVVKPTINNIDEYTTRILFASLRKQIAEQKVRIAELEIEARKQKIDKVISDNFEPLYVLI